MAQTPPMNLPPAATPWGRWAQGKIEELERSAARRQQAEENANQGQNATLAAMAKQILTLNATVGTLDETVTRLDDTVGTLDATVATLDTTVTRLDDTVAALVTPLWALNTITGFAVPQPINNGITVSASLTVPPNAAKCSLIIIADAFVNGQSTGQGNADIFLSITDPITSVAYTMAHIPENAFSSAQAFAIGGVNNVTPGDTMTFKALLRTGTSAGLPSNANNYLTVSAMATFQR